MGIWHGCDFGLVGLRKKVLWNVCSVGFAVFQKEILLL